MQKTFFSLLAFILGMLCAPRANAVDRQWTVADGLPTGEVHQIIELPNGQMLVNCEGIFCLSDGRGFRTVPCDYVRTYHLEHYHQGQAGYYHLWQGDSLLWLRDYYRIYLFDTRTRSFRYDIEQRLDKKLLNGFSPSPSSISDRQGGRWEGTMQNGIIYNSPVRQVAEHIKGSHPLINIARSVIDRSGRVWHCRTSGLECDDNGHVTHYDAQNVKGLKTSWATFITQLSAERYLLCDSLRFLGYFYPDSRKYISLTQRLPSLRQYRHIVGACVVSERWTVVYSQNGAFMLDTKADTVAALSCATEIEHYSDKYNCMVQDGKGNLWAGTQNGLFCLSPTHGNKAEDAPDYTCSRISGLRNNCIRSLLLDARGLVWAGTSCGVSRITPAVINFGPEDNIPAVSMMERAACLTSDKRLVFVINPDNAVIFKPEWLYVRQKILPVVITSVAVNGEEMSLESLTDDITLAHTENTLSFGFSALNYATPMHTRYRYRLAGLEEGWQDYSDTDGSMGNVTYRGLKPDRYVFEVQAALGDSRWGPIEQIAVTVQPPLWLTWWAKIVYAIIVFALLTILTRMWLKKKKEKMERDNDQRVNRLFELREEARHQFAEATRIDPQKIGVNDEEQLFTERILRTIEDHLSDADYGVDQLAQDVFMSRSALYQKLRNMLGISPADFIRNVRLKKAAQLLTDTDIPIGEIAYRIGYNTHKAFVTNFKKMFGILPSEYRTVKKDASLD